MDPNDKIGRCVRLALVLVRRRRLTTREAGAILSVDAEKARRDLDSLLHAGIGLRVDGEGRGRRYVLDGTPDLAVTFGERIALHFGRQLMEFLDGTLLPEWLEELSHKLDPVAATDAEAQSARLARRLLYVSEPYRRYSAHDDVIDTLFKALLENRELRVTHGRHVWGRFQPYTLAVYRRALYVVGHRPSQSGTVTLAVDRVDRVELTETTFRIPPDYRPERHRIDYFGIWRDPPPERVVLRFPADKRRLVVARSWHPTAKVHDLPDGRVELEMHAGGRELVSLALEWGAACEVVEPQWLRREVVAELRSALGQYVSSPLIDGAQS